MDFIPKKNIPGLKEFIDEAEEIILSLEQDILQLEVNPKKKSLIDRIFRGIHTLKGGAGIVMQNEMADYAHHFENLLDKVRKSEVVCSNEMATLLLSSLDGFRSFISNILNQEVLNKNLIKKSLNEISNFISTNILFKNNQSNSIVNSKNRINTLINHQIINKKQFLKE